MTFMNTEKETMSFEKALELLQEKINQLQKGNLPLDEALKTFQDAVEISRICNAKLDLAEEAVEKIVADSESDDYDLEDFEE